MLFVAEIAIAFLSNLCASDRIKCMIVCKRFRSMVPKLECWKRTNMLDFERCNVMSYTLPLCIKTSYISDMWEYISKLENLEHLTLLSTVFTQRRECSHGKSVFLLSKQSILHTVVKLKILSMNQTEKILLDEDEMSLIPNIRKIKVVGNYPRGTLCKKNINLSCSDFHGQFDMFTMEAYKSTKIIGCQNHMGNVLFDNNYDMYT